MSFLPTVPMRAYRRSESEVHLALGSGRGLVLGGLRPEEATAIVALGPLHPCQWATAGMSRAPSARWDAVVASLREAAHQLQPRTTAARRIVVTGTGDVPAAIVATLSGLSDSVVTDHLGCTRELHASTPPDLVVIPAADALDPFAARAWHRRGIPQLPIVVAADRLVIGPLVRPGEGPCLTCLDLHRADRDPAWADLVTGLAMHELQAPAVGATPEFLQLAAGFAGLVVRGMLNDRALPVGVSLAIESPGPRVLHHLWRAHPGCACAQELSASVRLAT